MRMQYWMQRWINMYNTCTPVNNGVHVYASACAAIYITPTHPQQTYAQMNARARLNLNVHTYIMVYMCMRLRA